MHIGMRTIKTAVGTAAAMLIAYSLHLEYWAAAGIITILSVQNTTKASFRLVAYRLLATLLGFVIAIGGVLDFRLQCVCFWRFLGDFYSDYQCVRGPKRDCDDCRFGNAFYDGAQLQLVLD